MQEMSLLNISKVAYYDVFDPVYYGAISAVFQFR